MILRDTEMGLFVISPKFCCDKTDIMLVLLLGIACVYSLAPVWGSPTDSWSWLFLFFLTISADSTEYDTLQGLDWTNQLDEYFIKAEADSNNKSDQDPFLWMYFGSTLGFVRHYPANQWVVEDTGSRFQNVCTMKLQTIFDMMYRFYLESSERSLLETNP